MFKGKIVDVALIGEAKQIYLQLEELAQKDKEHRILLRSIHQAIEHIKQNPQYGIHIKKSQIPKYYIKNFGAKNLWKCDLANFWRMIYWIDGSQQVKIVSFVLDIMDHKLYNKRFGY